MTDDAPDEFHDPTSTAYAVLSTRWDRWPDTDLDSFTATARGHLLDASDMSTADVDAIDWPDLFEDFQREAGLAARPAARPPPPRGMRPGAVRLLPA